jgi:hypothetical protein
MENEPSLNPLVLREKDTAKAQDLCRAWKDRTLGVVAHLLWQLARHGRPRPWALLRRGRSVLRQLSRRHRIDERLFLRRQLVEPPRPLRNGGFVHARDAADLLVRWMGHLHTLQRISAPRKRHTVEPHAPLR